MLAIELWVVRQLKSEILFCLNVYGDNNETMILYQWNELQWGHSNHEHLMTIECGLVLLTGAFNVFTLTKYYTCNVIHHKNSLYSLAIEKKCTQKKSLNVRNKFISINLHTRMLMGCNRYHNGELLKYAIRNVSSILLRFLQFLFSQWTS